MTGSKVRQCVGVLACIALWEAGAILIARSNPKFHNNLFPSVSYILSESLKGIAGFASPEAAARIPSPYLLAGYVLIDNSIVTLLRLLAGTAVGLLVGIGLGFGIGYSYYFRKLFNPAINVLRTVPLLALVPLFLVWFGGAPIGIYLYIVFAIAMLMVIYTVNAIQNVHPVYGQFAQTLGASPRQLFASVLLPAVVPELFGGIRVALGIAWGVTLAAEYLAAQDGLGRILIWSQIYMFAGRMIIIVLLFMLYSIALNAGIMSVRRRLLKWMP